MIKAISQILFIACMTGSCFSQLDPVDEWNLSGKVKAVTENSYTGISNGKEYVKGIKGWSYSWKNDSKIELDSNGNITRRTYFDNLAKPIRSDEFNFKKGKLIDSKTLYQSRTLEYDSLGNIKNELQTNRKFVPVKTGGETLKEENTSRIIYIYNSKNQVKQKLEFNLGNELKSTKNFSYDERSNLILEETVYAGSKDSVVYTYNPKNHMTKMVWFEGGGKIVERNTFEYIDGKVSYQKWEDFEGGKPDGVVEYIYEKGNEKSVVDFESDGSVAGKESHSYTYDKVGNWIKKVTIIDDEEIFVVERKIEYY